MSVNCTVVISMFVICRPRLPSRSMRAFLSAVLPLWATAVAALRMPSCIRADAPARARVLKLQFGGDGGSNNNFLDDLAKGFKAGFSPMEAEKAEAAEQPASFADAQDPTPAQIAAAEKVAADAKIAEARRKKVLAAKMAREAAAAVTDGPPEEELEVEIEPAPEVSGGRTTLSAEEAATFFAGIPQPKMLTPEEAAEMLNSPEGTPPPPMPRPSQAPATKEAPPATFGWANSETSPDEAQAAQIRALKDEAAAQAEAEAQGARILSADEEKALFAQAVAQAQESKAKAETGNSNAPTSFGLAVPSADQVKSYVSSLAETSTSAVPESAAVRAAAEAQAAKELEISRRSRDAGAEGAKPWWQALGAQALDAGGKIAQASMEAMSEANEKKKSEPVQSPLDPLTSMMKKSSKDSLYKQLDKAIDAGEFDRAATIKAQIDAL